MYRYVLARSNTVQPAIATEKVVGYPCSYWRAPIKKRRKAGPKTRSSAHTDVYILYVYIYIHIVYIHTYM